MTQTQSLPNSPTHPLKVFVYGTLKPGGRYHERYCQPPASSAQLAKTKGQLYDFPQWGYPAMAAGEDWVTGYLLTFRQPAETCAQLLQGLDALEGYLEGRPPEQNDYQRLQMPIWDTENQPLSEAWGYVMTLERVRSHQGLYLPTGYWPLP
jgi:gamma-glutamylcyclotransferase (GGCT)/AIG2-like uncharacterized protein YtfP